MLVYVTVAMILLYMLVYNTGMPFIYIIVYYCCTLMYMSALLDGDTDAVRMRGCDRLRQTMMIKHGCPTYSRDTAVVLQAMP